MTLLAPFAAVLDSAGPWIATASTAVGRHSRTLVFRAVSHDDVLKIAILPPDATGAVAMRLACCAIRYRARLAVETEARRSAMRALLLGIAELADARLAAGEGLDTLGGPGPVGRQPFGPALVRAMLAPDFVEGEQGHAGWRLERIGRDGAALALDFQRGHAERLRALVTPRERATERG